VSWEDAAHGTQYSSPLEQEKHSSFLDITDFTIIVAPLVVGGGLAQ